MDIEERSIAAQERMAEALESLAAAARAREERRSMLDERVADALTVLAGTLQDLSSGVQQTLQHIQRLHPPPPGPPMHSNGPDIKDVFL